MGKLLSIILLLFVCVSNAQVVKDTIKVNGDLLLGLNASGGNIPSYSGNLKSNFILKNSIWEVLVSPSYIIAYTPVNGEATLTKREFYTTISGSRFLTKGWKIVEFSEIENSFAQKMDLRWNVGFGPSYKIENDKFQINISEVVLYEKLSTSRVGVNDYNLLRASTRLKLIYKTKFGSISTIQLLQPAFSTDQAISTSEHLIYRTNNKLEFIISKNVSTGFTYDTVLQRYMAYSTGTIKPFDWNSAFFISYKL
jgi:hypothetical protein